MKISPVCRRHDCIQILKEILKEYPATDQGFQQNHRIQDKYTRQKISTAFLYTCNAHIDTKNKNTVLSVITQKSNTQLLS